MNQGVQLVVPPVTPVVKKLIIANVAIWILGQFILERMLGVPFRYFLALYPARVIYDFFLWQPFTYMFLHSYEFTHILFNMLMLWFVGGELEQRWGGKFFLTYYLVSGVGAALIYVIGIALYAAITGATQGMIVPVIGASGAIFGLFLAYGILFGERIIHFMFIFPMKAKYFVILLGAIQFMSMVSSSGAGSNVAYLAHLGGIVAGFLFLQTYTRFKQKKWKKKMRPRARKLKLVVDNEKKSPSDDDGGPKYWH